MMPRVLLCLIEQNDPSTLLESAIAMGQDDGLHVRCVVVADAPLMPIGTRRQETWQQWKEAQQQISSALDSRVAEISAQLERRDCNGEALRLMVDTIDIADVAGLYGRYADLAVAAPPKGPNSLFHSRILEGLIFRSGRPFLLVPDGAKVTLKPRRVLVGWNGSIPAARALAASLDMLVGADAVTICMIDPVAREWASGEEPGFDVASYLAHHDISADVAIVDSKGRDAGLVLLSKARDLNADLLVMGAYGHSRLLEWIIGGSTREVLANADLPVLLAH
ncbi:universal stress protein [Rhizobium sp. EC-SD404]|uniref:universal stress protein n=1 Tax=Rhizobium sp. EC-SD404 TaxID=2038389 RepID=UPI001257038E|nr:universal stress protein [Rhizobium sp. EC-SD404]VVS96570.1 putative Universal stress protein [Rhizobium sp. EC-SD404]